MAVIITGGSGFIGSRLVEKLKSQGEDVINIDLSVGRDILDIEFLLKKCEEANPHAIYHLAANKNARASGKEATAVLEVNVAGTASLLYAVYARCPSLKRFVFASTGGALFDTKGKAAKPSDKPSPKGVYGFSKLLDEYMLIKYSETYSLPVAILRLSNVYGWEVGDRKNVIAKWLWLAHKGETLKVYNTFDMYRDYVYVEDVVNAFLKAPQGIWHISSGTSRSLREVYDTISEVIGREPPYEIIKTAEEAIEVKYSALDPSDAFTWWKPKYNFKEGVKATYEEMLAYLQE